MQAEIVATSGEGPPLVYVPGIDGSGELLLGTRARLERRFRLTRLRYGGDVSGDHASLAGDVAGCIAGLGCGPALVLAESFGVAVALHAALAHPTRIAGLALVNGFARFHDRIGLAITRGVFALAPQAWIHRARPRLAQRGLFAPRRDEAALRALVELDSRWFDECYRARLALIRRVDLRARLPEVRCPVALYASDHDRVVASVASAREMAALLPDATLDVLEEAGHVVLPLAAEPWVERLEHLAERAGVTRSA